MTDEELLSRADAIAERAYARYSNFHVGVAVLLRDGTVIEGVNVENAAFPLTVCAEKNAISTAITAGYGPGDFEAIAVNASPCGGCRQWVWEMKFDRAIFRSGGTVVTRSPGDLLPDTFDL
ncbi:MAG TPA: cytidine deaminase [Gaiellaceae bacterium]|nr:cytidine deaminase [Gaiellaceae bacterium]